MYRMRICKIYTHFRKTSIKKSTTYVCEPLFHTPYEQSFMLMNFVIPLPIFAFLARQAV